MKNTIYFVTLLFCLNNFAQTPEERVKMSLEQKALLESKKMQLRFNLTEEKTTTIAAVIQSHYGELKTLRQDSASKSKFEKRMALLDLQIAFKKEMKGLLTESHFEAWEKTFNREKKHKKKRLVRNHSKKQNTRKF